jgi:flagellar hook assembly protein FlgD
LARVLSLATVLGLLAASAVAFAITEGAKLTRSPIYGTAVTKVFSPKAQQAGDRLARVHFRLRTSERLTVRIRGPHGDYPRTLLSSRTEKRGAVVDLVWDGQGDNGLLQPDGVYTPVIKLERSHRTIVLPNPIRVDTTPPRITVPHPLHPVLSPDGDHHGDLFRVHYRVSERAHAILSVRVGTKTVQVEYTLRQKPAGTLEWNGTVKGKSLPHGTYLLSVSAKDTAGNVSKPFPFAVANVRYVTLARKRVLVRPGRRFAIRVSADAPTVRWKLRGRTGVARPGTLHFTAPRSSGVYFLYLFAGDHADRCAVVVA